MSTFPGCNSLEYVSLTWSCHSVLLCFQSSQVTRSSLRSWTRRRHPVHSFIRLFSGVSTAVGVNSTASSNMSLTPVALPVQHKLLKRFRILATSPNELDCSKLDALAKDGTLPSDYQCGMKANDSSQPGVSILLACGMAAVGFLLPLFLV